MRERSVRRWVQGRFSSALGRLDAEIARPVHELAQLLESSHAAALDASVPWIFCHWDVRAANVIGAGTGSVAFTDFSSGEFSPALVDLVMTRHQWLMGDFMGKSRPLSVAEAREILLGYHERRALSQSEIRAFPVVWAAYYADRLSFLYQKWGSKVTDPPFSNFDIHGELMRLPHRGIEMGDELLESAGISHSL